MVEANVLVVGGGAIGGITAARMTPKVRRVTVLDTNEEHVMRLRDPGLRWEDPEREHTTRIEAVTSADQLEHDYDLALVAVKSPFHREALEPVVAGGRVGSFVSLGNGLIQDRMQSYVGEGNLVACVVEWGGSNAGAGHLIADTIAPMVCGELDGAVRDRTRLLHACLSVAGEARMTENIRGMIWSKLLLNTTFTGLSAISGLRYGEVADHPEGREAALAIWAEGVHVGEAEGHELEPVIGVEPHDLVVESDTEREAATAVLDRMMQVAYRTRPSMLQDLEAGRTTEVDVVNGAVAAHGRDHAIPTPANGAVVKIVHAIEEGDRTSDPENLRAVLEAAGAKRL